MIPYDDLGRLIAVTDAENNTTEYEYNEIGSLLVQRDALGRETKYKYDSLGRRIQRTLPEGEVETSEYDILGRMQSRTDFNGMTTSYSYDIMNRVTEINADDSHPSLIHSYAPKKFAFDYDVLGRRNSAKVFNRGGTELYSDAWNFDDRGRLTAHNSTNGNLTYSYDDNNNLIEAKSNTTAGFHQRYQYDVLNRIEHIHYGQAGSATDKHLATYSYNAVGSMAEMGYLNGVNHSYQFDSLNRLTDLQINKLGATPAQDINQHHYQYTLNAPGHRTQIQELHSGRVINHTFDNLYRLTSESIAGGVVGSVNGYIGYTYDEVSNRTRRDSTVAGVTNQTHSYSLNDLLDHHTYDDNGSTIASPDLVNKVGKTSDDYDFRNKLLRRTSDSGDDIYMAYNADGHRVQKVIVNGGVLGVAKEYNYLVDSNNPTGYSQVVEEKDGLGSLNRSYHIGHQRFAMTDHFNGGVISYFSFDGHGSIRGLTDENGDLTEEYDFDSYGILIGFRKDVGSGLETQLVDDYASLSRNEFLFAGEQWDADMGMYYNRARYYDVENGRFNAMDDWEGSAGNNVTLNKYLYGNGNGVSYLDPSGNFGIATVIGKLFKLVGVGSIGGAVVGAGFGATNQLGVARGAWVGALSGAALQIGYMTGRLDDVVWGGILNSIASTVTFIALEFNESSFNYGGILPTMATGFAYGAISSSIVGYKDITTFSGQAAMAALVAAISTAVSDIVDAVSQGTSFDIRATALRASGNAIIAALTQPALAATLLSGASGAGALDVTIGLFEKAAKNTKAFGIIQSIISGAYAVAPNGVANEL